MIKTTKRGLLLKGGKRLLEFSQPELANTKPCAGFSQRPKRQKTTNFVETQAKSGKPTNDRTSKYDETVHGKDTISAKTADTCNNYNNNMKIEKQYNSHKKRKHNTNVKVIKRSSKVIEASILPKVMNINPRSIYNKIDEFLVFVEEEEVDIVCMSESHERAYPTKEGKNQTLKDIINLEDHVVISNPYQRQKGHKGGRHALVLNKKKFNIKDLQEDTAFKIPWGVEAVWAELTPKHVTNARNVKKIIVGSIYSKPNSRSKTKLIDHIAEVFNQMSTRNQNGLHWIVCGDTNDLKLDSILHLSKTMKQVVTKPTRIDSVTKVERILDPIITTMAKFYQEPKVLPPLDNDPDKNGKPSGHKIVVMSPINVIHNVPARSKRVVTVRPLPESGLNRLGHWLSSAKWENLNDFESAHEKAQTFQTEMLNMCDKIVPSKKIKISSDDQPFYNDKLDKLNRKKKREYAKRRKSDKWKELNSKFKAKIKLAKQSFYKTKVEHIKTVNPGKWYKELKQLCSYDQMNSEKLNVESINHMTEDQQAEAIAVEFAKVRNDGFEPLKKEDVNIPDFSEYDIPVIQVEKVKLHLSQLKTKTSQPDDDIPSKILKTFSTQIAEPLTQIINTSIKRGEWPDCWKTEYATPIPKEHPVKDINDLRNISGLKTCDKIAEKIISELIIEDMKTNLDPSQYANQPGVSIDYYLVKLVHKVLATLDSNSRGETLAVLATLFD